MQLTLKSVRLLLALSFVAGASSLVCETVWIHRFSFVFGSTAPAASAVVAVFLGGLAIGNWYFGALSARQSNPLRVFGILQFGVGVYAFLFPILIRGGESLYAAIYPRIAESVAVTAVIRIALAFLILTLPTIFMGGTVPLLLQGGMLRGESIGQRAGLLNALNTVGAAAGGLLCGFVLLDRFGAQNAGFVAGLLSLAAGISTWSMSASTQPAAVVLREEESAITREAEPLRSRWIVRATIACFTTSGFTGIAYEMLFLRDLVLYFRETIYLYTAVISIFIFWLGIGSAVAGTLLKKIRWPFAALGFTQLAIGVFSFLAFYLPAPWQQALFHAGRSNPASVFLFLFLLLALPATFMGATFPLVTAIAVDVPRTAGKKAGMVYALNTAGSIAGSLITVFVLIPVLGMERSIVICVAFNLLAGAALVFADREFPRRSAALAACTIGMIVPCAVKMVTRISLPLTILRSAISPGDEILDVRDGITGTTFAVQSARGGYELWSDSLAISETRNGSFYGAGIVPVILSPKIPEKVLSLAFGGGLSTYGMRLFPEVRQIDCVDLSADNIALSLKYFPENAGFRDDPRAHFIADDARNYLRYSCGNYDMISVEATPPRFNFRNAFLFTREFYAAAERRLNKGGFFVQLLPLADLSPAETRGVMKTFAAVFPHRALWFIGGPDVVMIGGDAPIVLNYEETARRLARPQVSRVLAERLSIAQYQNVENLFAGILADSNAWDAAAEGGEIFTEDRLPLMFSTGADRSADNILRIHQNLAPWSAVLARVADRNAMEQRYEPGFLEQRLEERRQFFAAHLYGPNDFYPAMLSYIQHYAFDKRGEYERLYEVLRARGLDADADDLLQGLRRSK